MCLWSNKEVSMEADHDIKVYKIFSKKRNSYYSPVFEYEYKNFQIGKIFIDKNFDFDSPKYHCPFKDFECENVELYEIGKGFHSYFDKKDALEFQAWLVLFYPKDYIIAECIIPAGTAYYMGYNDNKKATYCSEKIMINQIL